MKQDVILLEVLEKIGFTKKEARVYLALLELNKGTVTVIAKTTELKRSIIYVILEGLIQRGYVNEIPGKKIKTYQAIEPSIILAQLKKTTKNFLEMLPIFQMLQNKEGKRPRIHYIETTKGILNVYEEMNWAKNAFFITSFERIKKHSPTAIKNWVRDFKKSVYKLKARYLIPNNAVDIKIGKEFKRAGQKVRTLKALGESNMDFTIYDNKLALTSLEEKPFMVVIESETLAKSIQPLFEVAWKQGKELR